MVLENVWVPVPPKPKNPKPEAKKLFVPAKEVLHSTPLPLVVPPMQSMQTPVQSVLPLQAVQPMQSGQPVQPLLPVQAVAPMTQTMPMAQPVSEQSIFPQAPTEVSFLNIQKLH